MKIIWSPLAIERLEEIAEYIREDDPSAAKKWVISVFGRIQKLSKFPNSGRKFPEMRRENIREIIYGNYRIIYRIEKRGIEILTVRHVKQILPIADIL